MTIADISASLLRTLSSRESSIINARFGLSRTRPQTLEKIGQHFHLTRERVRQLEDRALRLLRQHVAETSFAEIGVMGKNFVALYGGVIAADVLIDKILQKYPSARTNERDHILFALVLHQDLVYERNNARFPAAFRLRTIAFSTLAQIADATVDFLRSVKDIQKSSVVYSAVRSVVPSNPSIPLLEAVFSLDKRVKILNDDRVGLMEWRHVNPHTIRDHIVLILERENKPLHFTDIAARLKDVFETLGIKRKIRVPSVHNELIRRSEFVLLGRGEYGLARWGKVSGTIRSVVVSYLADHKPHTREEIFSYVQKNRVVKEATMMLILRHTGGIERVGRDRYRLGVNVA